MPTLHIRLLGTFTLLCDSEPVNALNQGRLQSLLAYLILQRAGPQSRQHLAFLFWPDSSEAQARANLRQALHVLRQAWPDSAHFLQIDAKTLQWRADADFTLDVAAFEEQLALAGKAAQRSDDAGTRSALHSAIELYQGDLLPGCYDEWVLPVRERWQQAFFKALEQLILLAEAERDYAAAIEYAKQLLRYDPLHEATYGRLMRLHALHGDRASALRVYHTCATLLQRELGVEPSQKMRSAYEHLLNLEHSAKEDSSPATQLETSAGPRKTQQGEKLIGRRSEWQRMLSNWRTATSERASLLVVAGEAGIGKTRLAEELAMWVGQQGIRTVRTRAYAAEGALAYAPVAEWLRAEPLRARWHSLDAVWLTELARILPELLVEQPRLPRPEPLSESWQRKRLFEALGRAVLSDPRPLLLVLDDLQWCDHETLAWLHYLLRYAPQAPLLIAGTMRPEEVTRDHPLTTLLLALRNTEQVVEVELGPLSLDETAALAAQVAGQQLAPGVAQRLYGETEGNPLFVVETIRSEVSKGGGVLRGEGDRFAFSPLSSQAPLPLSAKVHAVIQRRLDQLSPTAQQLANLASVIGRSFTFPVLAQASELAEEALMRGLDELWQRRIIRELGADAYDFSHDRIREVTQASVSQTQRRLLHRRAAQALEQVYAADLEPVIGQIAAHYERAGLAEPAIAYYLRAAEIARRLYATQDAIELFTRGLQLLHQLPESTQRDAKEIDLQTKLAVPLVFAKGYDAPEVRQAYRRALALTQRLNRPPGAPILRGLALTYMAVGAVQEVHALGVQVLDISRLGDDPALSVEAHYLLGVASFWMGAFTASRIHLEKAVACYDPNWHPRNIELYSHDSGAICLVRLALSLWTLGYPDQAMAHSCAAIELAKTQNHLLSLAYVHSFSAWICRLRGELAAAIAENEALLSLCHQHGLPFWPPTGWTVSGELLVAQGEIETGLAQLQHGLAGFETESQNLHRPYILALAAQAYGAAGNAEQGLMLVEAGLTAAIKTEEHFWDAELYRLRGTLRFAAQRGCADEVEADFQQALAIARGQDAKSLELRAAVSLGRLWQRQGKVQAAHDLVAEIYNWFSEGFDTADLQEASALLATLS